MLRKIVNFSMRYIEGFVAYYAYIKTPPSKTPNRKILYLHLKHNVYRRYLYIFIKFFYIEGYHIHLPKDFRLIAQLQDDPYAALLLKEKMVSFGKPKNAVRVTILDISNLDPDYFFGLIKSGRSSNNFQVPIPMHPFMYHYNFWNLPVNTNTSNRRKQSIFMAGNFDNPCYQSMAKNEAFNVSSRQEVLSYLKNKNLLHPIKKRDHLDIFLNNAIDKKIILISRTDFKIPMKELRATLGKFDFFFALPGAVMPFCHNIIEAMSVGTIPLIQEDYAKLFRPPLSDGVNAYTFSNLNDLETKITQLFSQSDDTIFQVRARVLHYYNQHLTPQSVVNKLENSNFDTVYLMAQHYSAKLIQARTEKSI